MGDLNFNIDEAPVSEYEPLKGIFLAEITNTAIKDTKSGGKGLRVDFELIDEKYGGRKINDFFNIVNPNPKAEVIGLGKLGGLCKMLGLGGVVENSCDLIGGRIYVKLDTEQSKESSPDGTPYTNTVIKSYIKDDNFKGLVLSREVSDDALFGGDMPPKKEKKVLEDDEIPF